MVDPGDGEPARLYGDDRPASRCRPCAPTLVDDRVVVRPTGAGPTATADGARGRAGGLRRRVRRGRATSPADAAHRVVLLVPLLRAGHRRRRRGEPHAPSTRTSWRSTWSRSTTAGAPGLGEGLRVADPVRLPAPAGRRDPVSGRRFGLWLAPFLVGADTTLAREHPDWLVGPAGHNWGQDLVGLDLTHPGVRDLLHRRPSAAWWRWAWTTSSWTSSTPARSRPPHDERPRRGLPLGARAGPRGGRAGRLPRRVWRAPAAERRSGRRDAGLARHLPRGRRGRLDRLARPDATGRPGLAAGPALDQRPRLRRGPPSYAQRERWAAAARRSAAFGPSPTGLPSSTTGASTTVRALLADGGTGRPFCRRTASATAAAAGPD